MDMNANLYVMQEGDSQWLSFSDSLHGIQDAPEFAAFLAAEGSVAVPAEDDNDTNRYAIVPPISRVKANSFGAKLIDLAEDLGLIGDDDILYFHNMVPGQLIRFKPRS
jgi:hypothetical protein